MLISGYTAYKELKDAAKVRYKEVGAYKVKAHELKVIIAEQENGSFNVDLFLSTVYVYRNNHTNHALSHNTFESPITKDCTKAGAEAIAELAKRDVEAKTKNTDVWVQFIKYTPYELI